MLPSLLPRRPAPAAVIPRADDEIVLVLRVVLLERAVDRDRAVEVLLIPPAGDVQRRHADAVEVLHERFALPERIEVGMLDEVVPGRGACPADTSRRRSRASLATATSE